MKVKPGTVSKIYVKKKKTLNIILRFLGFILKLKKKGHKKFEPSNFSFRKIILGFVLSVM